MNCASAFCQVALMLRHVAQTVNQARQIAFVAHFPQERFALLVVAPCRFVIALHARDFAEVVQHKGVRPFHDPDRDWSRMPAPTTRAPLPRCPCRARCYPDARAPSAENHSLPISRNKSAASLTQRIGFGVVPHIDIDNAHREQRFCDQFGIFEMLREFEGVFRSRRSPLFRSPCQVASIADRLGAPRRAAGRALGAIGEFSIRSRPGSPLVQVATPIPVPGKRIDVGASSPAGWPIPMPAPRQYSHVRFRANRATRRLEAKRVLRRISLAIRLK